MKKLITTLLALCLTTTASFSDVKLGIIIGFTGPIESLTPDMAAGLSWQLTKLTNLVVFLWEMYQASELTKLTCIDFSCNSSCGKIDYLR